MSQRNDEREHDIYIIPQNFIEGGKIMGGMFRMRNAAEAGIVGVLTGFPIMNLSMGLYGRIVLLCVITLPLVLFALIGIGDHSLSEFVISFFAFLRKRRVLGEDPNMPVEEDLSKIKKALRRFGNLFRRKIPVRKVEASPEEFEIVYYDSEDEIPEEAAGWENYQPPAKSTTAKEKGEKKTGKASKIKGVLRPPKPEDALSLEEYIPIDKVENGIIKTKDGRYVKILEIEPINFLLRSPREQRNIVFSFASLLKITPIRLQFKVISRKADVNKHLQMIREYMATEKNPRCRELQKDYFNLIRRVGSREAVTRRFFMIFEYQAPLATRRVEYKEVIAMLETTARNARSYLRQCGNDVVEHDNEDEFIAEVFYTLFNRRSAVNITLQDRVAKTIAKYITSNDEKQLDDISVNELVKPLAIDFTHSKYIVMDGLYHSYLIIPSDSYKMQVVAGWLSLMINAGEGIDVDIFFYKEPKERVQQKIGQQIRINRSKIKDTSDTNTDFDDLSGAIQSGYFLKRGIANNEDFYYMSILITITSGNVNDLEWRVSEMKKLLISQDMDAKVCSFQQEQAFLSSLPIVSMDKKLFDRAKRNLLTTGAASCYPFTSFEMSDDSGVLMGVNKHNNSLVIVDIFNSRLYKNANMAILGTSGAGKTFTMQLLALRLRMKGIQVFILPPLKGHEFRRACTNTGGEFISINPASRNCINVMAIRKIDTSATDLLDGPQADRSELAAKIQKLHIFFSLLIPDMSYEEKQLLDECIIRTYNAKGITHKNESLIDPEDSEQFREMPLLGDLHQQLLNNPETRRLANILNRLVNGSASTFNQHTNVDLSNLYTVIDISELSGDLLPVGMFTAFDFMYDEAKRDRTVSKAIFVPEAWKLIGAGSNAQVASYILEAVKIIRGYGGSIVIDTQDINDFFALEEGRFGRGILNNCKTKIILNMEDEEARRVQDILHLTDTELMNITHFPRGSGLISTNNNNVTVEFKSSEFELELVTTDKQELSRLLQKKAQERNRMAAEA